MTIPTEIGLEQAGPNGEGSMFALKTVDKSGSVEQIVNGKMAILTDVAGRKDHDSGIDMSENGDESDAEEDHLDRYLDSMYDQYQNRKSESDAKFRAKKARREYEDGDWEGFSADGHESAGNDVNLVEDSSDDSDEEGVVKQRQVLLTDLRHYAKTSGGLSRRAEQFFDQDIFRDIGGLSEEIPDTRDYGSSSDASKDHLENIATVKAHSNNKLAQEDSTISFSQTYKEGNFNHEDENDDDGQRNGGYGFEIVKRGNDEARWDDQGEHRKDGRLDIEIITAEAMTLAQQIASGEKSKHDLVDDGFNKYAFKDRDGLPEWFLDDESRHDQPHRPISAAGAAAIKEKLRALNARPIKKVREAKDRKKFKAAQRLEKLRKKSALLNDEEGMTEKEKAQSIAKLMSKAGKKRPKQQGKVVVARGQNARIAGRPRGVKGKYKIVDARLKKDTRAEKRLAKNRKQ